MLRLKDRIAQETVHFYCVQHRADLDEVREYVSRCTGRPTTLLGIDTESTGLNCYARDWKLRLLQIGDLYTAYVIPARYREFITWLVAQDVKWVGHNGAHDVRCIDAHLGHDTGLVIPYETYIPAMHADSRNQMEGGVGHGLKELACQHVSKSAGKWEAALKVAFKRINIEIPGSVYRSGPNKGKIKTRPALMTEGWSLIADTDPAYVAYAAADPILTRRLWRYYAQKGIDAKQYTFDHAVTLAVDRLQRRAIKLDVPYTQRLDNAYTKAAELLELHAAKAGIKSVYSGAQVAAAFEARGVKFTERTPTGKVKTSDDVIRTLLDDLRTEVRNLAQCVLPAKQLHKRQTAYTQAMLREVDVDGRIHPSINAMAARTFRMSVSNPPLQQLPIKNREDDIASA